MPALTHPTRMLLLDAGLTAAESGTLAATSVDEVVRVAGVSKGTFYVHFVDRAAYLAELHRSFYDALGAKVRTSMDGTAPGGDRLRRGTTVYLDECFRARGVKAMLVDIRSEPSVAARIREHNAQYIELVVADFAALGTEDPTATATLFIAAVHEVALAELERGRRSSALRRALWRLGGIEPAG